MKRLATLLALLVVATTASAAIIRVCVDDMIHPITDEFIGRAIDDATLAKADALLIELKSVEKIFPVHLAQLLSYLRLMDKRVGLLINFNVPMLRHGVKRVVNRF